jgi:very-short-patch-repair endonuclease
MLVVEIDGSSHDGLEARDRERDRKLTDLGYRVIRFSDDEVTNRLDFTLGRIADALKPASPTSEPSTGLAGFPEAPERGRG